MALTAESDTHAADIAALAPTREYMLLSLAPMPHPASVTLVLPVTATFDLTIELVVGESTLKTDIKDATDRLFTDVTTVLPAQVLPTSLLVTDDSDTQAVTIDAEPPTRARAELPATMEALRPLPKTVTLLAPVLAAFTTTCELTTCLSTDTAKLKLLRRAATVAATPLATVAAVPPLDLTASDDSERHLLDEVPVPATLARLLLSHDDPATDCPNSVTDTEPVTGTFVLATLLAVSDR